LQRRSLAGPEDLQALIEEARQRARWRRRRYAIATAARVMSAAACMFYWRIGVAP